MGLLDHMAFTFCFFSLVMSGASVAVGSLWPHGGSLCVMHRLSSCGVRTPEQGPQSLQHRGSVAP